jgi:hypothetical protein
MSLWTAIIAIVAVGSITSIITKMLELSAAKHQGGDREAIERIEQRLEALESSVRNRDDEIETLRSDLSFYRKLTDK